MLLNTKVFLFGSLLLLGVVSSCSTDGKSSTVGQSDSLDTTGVTIAETPCDPVAGRLECNDADFSKQSLDGLILVGGSFRGADFSYASLKGANFDGADLRYAKFNYANLMGANISRTNLGGSSFEYANLVGAKIQDVCLKNLNFDYSDLSLADFARSKGGVYIRAKASNLTLAKNLDMLILGTENCS